MRQATGVDDLTPGSLMRIASLLGYFGVLCLSTAAAALDSTDVPKPLYVFIIYLAIQHLISWLLTETIFFIYQVRRIKNVRAMTRSRSNSISSNTSSIGTQGSTTPRLQSAMARPAAPPAPKSFREKVKLVLLGEKGSGLPEYGFGYAYAAGKGQKAQKSRVKPKGKGAEVAKQENPVARLKLLLVRFCLLVRVVW